MRYHEIRGKRFMLFKTVITLDDNKKKTFLPYYIEVKVPMQAK